MADLAFLYDRALDCLAEADAASLPLYPLRPDGLAAFLDGRPRAQAGFLTASGFTAAAQELRLLQGEPGLAGAVLGLGTDRSPFAFGDLPRLLPGGTVWHLEPGDYEKAAALLGFCLGAYRFPLFAKPGREAVRLVPPAGVEFAREQARATWLARDLINAPANLLGPQELAEAAAALGARYGATVQLIAGAALAEGYPAVAAVGQGAARPPVVAVLHWSGSRAAATAKLIALCGKGVVFDSGGYDLKPSAGMQRMKKDMGGAAAMLAAARLIMAADLPVRLALYIGCVENSVSGAAMRPLDVIATRKGLSVEIGNTDAEGRLVLADLLCAAAEESPAWLIDGATLTGAARVALGPDLPALFCNDEHLAGTLLASGSVMHDPLWRLPLWEGYDSWLSSPIADLNNISGKPHAGAVVAALFLRRFVPTGISWAHIDLYAWNDQPRPGRPEGGEAQAARAIFKAAADLMGVAEGAAGVAPR